MQPSLTSSPIWSSPISSFWLEFLRGMLKPAAATAVVAMAVALSFAQRLGIEWEMMYSIARAFLQLSVIGFVLEFIFTQRNAAWIVLAYLFMVVVAGYTAGQRAKHVPRGNYIAGASIMAGTLLTMLLLVVLNVFPFVPRYIIPVSGMMVGNAMTVTGVTMKKLREDLKVQKDLVGCYMRSLLVLQKLVIMRQVSDATCEKSTSFSKPLFISCISFRSLASPSHSL